MQKILLAEPVLTGNELKYVSECIKTNWISSVGKYVSDFEAQFSKYCGSKFGVAASSGTAALHLALKAAGIKQGDEVILPTLTMVACANSIAYTGAKIALVDSEYDTWNMDVNLLEKKITSKTKAIMPVHIYGHPVDMDVVNEVAAKHNLYVIEDAAEAHGAEYKSKKVGSIGHIGCFSFYANKIITTGEGGMVVTDNEELNEKCRAFRNLYFDKERRFIHKDIGFNYRMTNIQAALGLAQLENIEKFVDIRRKNAKMYNDLLGRLKEIVLPPEASWAKNVYWMYTILVNDQSRVTRDALMSFLATKGVETRVVFNPMHRQPAYSYLAGGSYPVAEKLSESGLNLPSGNNITEKEIHYIVDSIKEALR